MFVIFFDESFDNFGEDVVGFFDDDIRDVER
jgi:hypothetical protein